MVMFAIAVIIIIISISICVSFRIIYDFGLDDDY